MDQTFRPGNDYGGVNLGPGSFTVGGDFPWRMPTFADDEFPDCRTTGTVNTNIVNELHIGQIYDSKEDFGLKIKNLCGQK